MSSFDTRLSYEQSEARHQREHQRAQQQAAALEAGYACLGYTQELLRGDGGRAVGAVWTRRGPEDVRGLPPALVVPARAAVQAEEKARAALQAAARDARDYVQRHQLSSEAAKVKVELLCAEVGTTYREAASAAPRLVYALGEVALKVQAARAVLQGAPGQLAAIEQRAEAARRQLADQVDAARRELAALGASE